MMMLASAGAAAVTGIGLTTATQLFLWGVLDGCWDVVALILAGLTFVGGLDANGITDKLIQTLRERGASMPVFSMITTMVSAALTGSGDALVISLNAILLKRAEELDVEPLSLGSLTWLGGEMGRCLSPIAAVTVVTAKTARVAPMQVVGLTALPILVAALTCLLLLMRRQRAPENPSPTP